VRLSAGGREGLKIMAEVAALAKCGQRDPRVIEAAEFIDSLPAGPIETYQVYLDSGCEGCSFETKDGICVASVIYQDHERACWYDTAPDWCWLRGRSVLVTGVAS